MKATACAAALALLLAACSGGHSSTTPTSPQNQLAVSVTLDLFSPGALLAASISLDGQEIGRSDWSSTGGCTGPCLVLGAQNTIPAAGHHTVTVTVLRETLPSVDYDVRGEVFLSTPDASGTIPLPVQSQKLTPGGTVTYDIQI